MNQNCPLCKSISPVFHKNKNQIFFKCLNCLSIFLANELLPTPEFELSRYKAHNNDVFDVRYQKFVSPIVSSIMADFYPEQKGLDFGAGTGPVISKLLKDNNFQIEQYDPFFHNFPELLDKKYDYIACCEVIEHFHNPFKEFGLLKQLLNPDGKLYCMTEIFHSGIEFSQWYYKNDPTHVFIYEKDTFEWIKKTFNFSHLTVEGRLATFTN